MIQDNFLQVNKDILNLSKREKEILLLIAEGLKNGEIADKLFISHRTADTHKTHLIKKLNLKSTAELACFATINLDVIKSLLDMVA